MSVKWWVIAVLGMVLAAEAWSAEVIVRKTRGDDANPTLAVADVQAPAEIKERLLRALKFSDWFSLVDKPEQASYVLTAVYGAGPALDLRVTSGGQPVASVHQTAGGPNKGWLVYRAVDAVITQVFKSPGLCASRIAFAGGNGEQKEVMLCNFDGTDSVQLTHNGSISTEPSWGPGATALVYTVYGSSWTDVALIDIARNRQKRVSQFPGLNAGADLSADGRSMALCLSRDRRVELYVMPASGGSPRRLTNDAAVESSPTWSPDGSGLCFVSDRNRVPRLFLIPAAGGTARPLLADSDEAVSPDWSQVSNKVCFATRLGGSYAIAMVDMNDATRERQILTRAGGDWESPSWAPDGRHIVCSRRLGSRHELCILDSKYGKVRPITNAGSFTLPSWSDLH